MNVDKNLIIKHSVFYCIIFVNIGIEFAYRQPLYDASLKIQHDIQDNWTQAGKDTFWAFSFWGNGAPYYLTFVFMLNWTSRARSFYYLLFLTFTIFIMNITKMAYHEPRPFMKDDDLEPYGCSAEYGNPSGHSLFAGAFNTFFFLDLCHGDYSPMQNQSKFKYYILLFLSISLTSLICFARLYVNVHTINQILYGLIWGIWIAFYFHFCLRKDVLRHINSITVRSQSRQIPYSSCILISTIIAINVLMGQIVTFLIVDDNFEPNQEWILNIEKKCKVNIKDNNNVLNYKSVVYSGFCMASYGAYLGILFSRKKFGQVTEDMHDKAIVKFLARYLIIGLLTLPFLLPFFLIQWTASLAVLIIFKTLVPFICVGFVIYGPTIYFFRRFNLVKETIGSSSVNYRESSEFQ
ncbi:pap2 superfamily phosphatase [Stylonychia lemnae]|uniref:Pap2 superfamily phosphatase n=1 Tax=Stylonychia lemnae TaxID=5949 RepID=A0A078B8N5_STYLE|nr:pap2 superfamily phosphatase [Stylonychia lemnae]|eukprot:CDW89672.1 pap2 superfamily phosphatase [Stylonychia lemnae]